VTIRFEVQTNIVSPSGLLKRGYQGSLRHSNMRLST